VCIVSVGTKVEVNFACSPVVKSAGFPSAFGAFLFLLDCTTRGAESRYFRWTELGVRSCRLFFLVSQYASFFQILCVCESILLCVC
jgi:hypothetical protein